MSRKIDGRCPFLKIELPAVDRRLCHLANECAFGATRKTLGNTGYTRRVAKVMVSLPDDLLERIDTRARARHATRSGFLRELAERELLAGASEDRAEIEELLGNPVHLGGDGTSLIREDRRSR